MKNGFATLMNAIAFAFALLLTSLGSNVSHAAQLIPQDKLPLYEHAAQLAVYTFGNQCERRADRANLSVGDFNPSINSRISNAQSATVANIGEQPALTFYIPSSNDVESRTVITIISSADYKQAVELRIEGQHLDDVNVGTLREPSFSKQWITQPWQTYYCK